MRRGMAMHVLLVLSCVCASVLAQYGEGPLPPRLQVPGAIPVPGPGPGQGPQRPRVAVRQRRPQQQARQQAYLPTPPSDLDDGRPQRPTPRPPPILAQARPAPLPTTLPPRPVEEDPEEYDEDEETAAPPSTLSPTTSVVYSAPQQPIFRTSRPPQPSPTPSVYSAPQQPIFRTARPQIRNQDPPAQFRQQAQLARPAARPVVQLTSPLGVTVADIPVSPNRQQFRQQSPPRPAVFRPERPINPEPPRQQLLVRQQEDTPRQQQSPPRPAVFRPERPIAPEPPRQQLLVRQQEDTPRQQQRQQSRPTPVAIDDEDEEVPDVPRQQFRQQVRPTPQAAPQQFVRQQQKQQPQPQQRQQQTYSPYKPPRDRKPVAQVLRKYRDDNPDGSITWGYENDDGSFKEETIGIDCIVSGKYGYVDPDGMRREYTYSSGIRCDKNKEEEEEKGYMDYQNNAFVLPNGQSIDLQSFNTHKSRRPVAGK